MQQMRISLRVGEAGREIEGARRLSSLALVEGAGHGKVPFHVKRDAFAIVSQMAEPMRSDFSASYCIEEHPMQPARAEIEWFDGYVEAIENLWTGKSLTYWLQEYVCRVLIYSLLCGRYAGAPLQFPEEPLPVLYPRHEWDERIERLRENARLLSPDTMSVLSRDPRIRLNPWAGKGAAKLAGLVDPSELAWRRSPGFISSR